MSAMQYRQHVFTELLTSLQVTGWSAVKAPLVPCAGVQERGEGGGGQDERGAGRRGAGLLAPANQRSVSPSALDQSEASIGSRVSALRVS